MSEGDVWRSNRARLRSKHAANKTENTRLIVQSGLPHVITNSGETISFRQPEKPPVDFWPSSGKWRICREKEVTYNGGAASFLGWYAKQKEGAKDE